MVAVSAHRGGSEHAPHGSLDAYQAALDAGADFVEVDVRRQPDGQLICSHDPPQTGEAPAPLDAVLRLIAQAGSGAHVDVKEAGYENALIATVAAHLPDPRVWYTTGEPASVRALVAAGAPTLLTLGSITRDRRPYRRIEASGAAGIAVKARLASRRLRRWCHEHDLAVLVWTVNDDAGLRRFLAADDVTVVVTDRPAAALEIRRTLHQPGPDHHSH